MPTRRELMRLGRDDKRAAILAAARDLFQRDGYHETTIEHIVEDFGVTKPFLYYYFDSKEHLLASLVADEADVPAACREYGAGGKTIRAVQAQLALRGG